MTITARLTAFFLFALAAVLIGFSAALYLIVRNDLYRDADARLAAAVQTLEAAAQIRPDGVEFEPPERHVALGSGLFASQIEWSVQTVRGQRLAQSARFPQWQEPLEESLPDVSAIPTLAKDTQGRAWSHLRRVVEPKSATRRETSPTKFAGLVIDAAVLLEPLHAALTKLALTMLAVSLAVWLLALFAGRWFCRRALRPVIDMAVRVRLMRADRLEERLPLPENRDELHSLGESFNDLLNHLQESFERQKQFSGNASHQLRTPLAGLLGQVEVALRQPRSAEDYRETLLKAQASGQQLKQIIESLLFLTRANREAMADSFEKLEASEWIDSWAAQRENLQRFSDLQIEKPTEPCLIRAQPALLAQLLDNLFDNAVKYSLLGTPLKLAISIEGERVIFSMENQGEGISLEEQARLFEPFYRTERSRRSSIPGVGLGLAVVKRIAEAFGGSVRVESEVGKMTRFEVELPRVA